MSAIATFPLSIETFMTEDIRCINVHKQVPYYLKQRKRNKSKNKTQNNYKDYQKKKSQKNIKNTHTHTHTHTHTQNVISKNILK